LDQLDLYPVPGQLEGALTDGSLFASYTDYNIDFNGNPYQWIFRGAYSGSGTNPGWKLKLDTMPTPHGTITAVEDPAGHHDFLGMVYPNPAGTNITIDLQTAVSGLCSITLTDLEGRSIQRMSDTHVQAGKNEIHLSMPGVPSGFYLIVIDVGRQRMVKKLLRM
jgi:hypothetical protein